MIIFLKLRKKSKKMIHKTEDINIETLNTTNNNSSHPKFQTKASFKEMSVKELLELKAKNISKTIKIQYENNYLDYSTIHQLMEKTITLCQYEYNHQTEENRILRRLIMNQENEYEQEIFKYLSEINKIINEDVLKAKYPNCYAYLLNNKIELENRQDSRTTIKEKGVNWYSLMRKVDLNEIDTTKKVTITLKATNKFGRNNSKKRKKTQNLFYLKNKLIINLALKRCINI